MKINETALSKLTIMGIYPSKPSIHAFPLSKKLVVNLAFASLSASSLLVYLFYEASTLKEYMGSIAVSSGAITISLSFGTIAFQMKKFFDTLDAMQKTIDESKLKIIISMVQ